MKNTYLATELSEFRIRFEKDFTTKVPLLNIILKYIIKTKGKQMRPRFVLNSAALFGTINDSTYIAASLIELLHTATLVHDDVVDDANQRRSKFSINALWKNKIAVLVGDFLLSKGMLVALENDEFQLLKLVSNAVKEMSEGELLQIEKARKLDIKEDIYYEIIRSKTASLLASACAAGTYSTTKDDALTEQMRQFGENLGISFQIKDDLFDYGIDDVGKPLGIDIKEQKMTLPLIYTLNTVDKSTKKELIYLVKNKNTDKKAVQKVITTVKENGGMDYAKEIMNDYQQKAINILDTLPNSKAKDEMRQLVTYVTNRKI